MDKGLLLFYDWEIAFEELDVNDFKEMIMAMLRFKRYGTKPPEFKGLAKVVASFIFPQLERELESISDGKKGGRPKKINSSNKEEENQLSSEEKSQSSAKEVIQVANEEIKEKKSNDTPRKDVKCAYGKFKNVMLTTEEFDSLKGDFPFDYDKKIDDLSYYIQSKGDNYASHYGTILSWARKSSQAKEPSDTYSTFDTDDFFKEALARSNRELKNSSKSSSG